MKFSDSETDYMMLDLPKNAFSVKIKVKFWKGGEMHTGKRELNYDEIRESVDYFDDYIARYIISEEIINNAP